MERQSRRHFLQASAVASAGVIAGCSTIDAGAAGSRTILGVYTGESPLSQLKPFEQWLGLQHAVVVCFVDATRPPAKLRTFFDDVLTDLWNSGYIPMVTWEASSQSDSEVSRNILETINSGGYDDVIDRWARDLARWLQVGDRRLYFRPLPEMNRAGTPWSTATPRDYRIAWHRLHRRVANEGIDEDRLQWVWNPNATDVESPPAEAYYPGDRFVDWVGIDGYNFGDAKPWSTWQSPDSVFTPMLDRLRDHIDKPVMVPEFGSTSRRQGAFRPAAKAQWIQSAFEYFRRQDVRLACWFNTDKETDWAVFGGVRGTDTFQGGGERYHTYSAYRQIATGHGVQGAKSASAGVLSDDAFVGSGQ
ncbi:endoglucanase [Halococcus sp. IIIV-5B]|nr:endoglucanase [Halococcus sp. IIIV-5B]